MKRFISTIIFALALILAVPVGAGQKQQSGQGEQAPTVKAERNHLRSGNSYYKNKDYGKAEVEYRKALEANPRSAAAQFNLATALLRQQSSGQAKKQDGKKGSDQQSEAISLLTNLAKTSRDQYVASRSAYDLGNVAYHQQDYQQAIEAYKQALRVDPTFEDARYNLRMAQLKLKQNNKGGGGGGGKNKDKQKQNQKNKQNQNKDKQNQQPQKQNPKPEQGLSKENMERILQSVQNQEQAAQQRAKAARAQQQQAERERTRYKW